MSSLNTIIIILTCIISIVGFYNSKIIDDLIFWPPAISQRRQYYRLVTCGLIHADYMHLGFNMFTLYIFGGIMEEIYSRELGLHRYMFFILYVGALVFSILPTYFKHRNDSQYRSLGASGAVCAVLFAFILVRPWATILVFVIPVPGLLCLYVAQGWWLYQPRCTFLGSVVWYPVHHRRQAPGGRHFPGRTIPPAFQYLAVAWFGK